MHWIELGFLNENNCDFSKYNKDIGLYRAKLKDKIVYIGKATELKNGGFRKRLRDYTRNSNSARKSESGRLMNKNQNQIIIEVLIFERNEKIIPSINAREQKEIDILQPEWNKIK